MKTTEREMCVFFFWSFSLSFFTNNMIFYLYFSLICLNLVFCDATCTISRDSLIGHSCFFFVFCLNVVLIKTPFLVLHGSTYDSFGFLCSCCCFGLVQTECATSRSVCLIFAFFFCFVYPLRMCLCIWGHYIRIGIEI